MQIIDLGACVGAFFSKYINNGNTIYAIEPQEVNYNALLRLQDQTRLYCDLKVYKYAVCGESNKQVKLYRHKDKSISNIKGSTGSSIINLKDNVDINDFEIVETITLSDFIKQENIKCIDILKIDIEGAEFLIFEDLLNNSLINRFKYIIYEDHRLKYPKIVDKDWSNNIMDRLLIEYNGKLERFSN